MTRYDVVCPSAAWENTSTDEDQVSDLCLSLSQDHGYVQVRCNGVIIEEYVDGAIRYWSLPNPGLGQNAGLTT